jgi:hypothetical protein
VLAGRRDRAASDWTGRARRPSPSRTALPTYVKQVQDEGPGFFVVAGIPKGDTPSIRSVAGTGDRIIARVSNGTTLRNTGAAGPGRLPGTLDMARCMTRGMHGADQCPLGLERSR